MVNLAASAALDGERVLLADMDKQGVSYAVGLITPPTTGDLANALVGSTALLIQWSHPPCTAPSVD